MSDLSLITAPPADVQMFAAGAPRIPAAGPAANGIATQAPAGIAADGGSADSSSKPFAALLMGFLQGAQPAAPTVAAPTASENSASADDLLLPDASTDGTELLAIPAVAVPGQQALTAKSTAASSGTTSPASGNRLPPELPELPGNPSPTAQVPSQMDSSDAIPTARISLADIEHSRQLNMATSTQALQADAKALAERFMPAANSSLSAMPGTASATDSSGDLLPGAEADGILLQPAGLTAGDLSRLVQNLAQNGGRESFSAAFSTAGKGTGSLSGTVTTTTAENGGLGNMVRGSLGGFPPLQPLGSPQAWTTGLGDRLLTLAGPGTHSARLRLHPESLGTLDIEIKIADSTAQVWFGAQHSQTREAIEASLPQLREMFAEQGIRLAHAQVDSGTDQRTPDQQQGFDEPGTSQNPWHRSSARSSLADTLAPIRQATNRLLDAWA